MTGTDIKNNSEAARREKNRPSYKRKASFAIFLILPAVCILVVLLSRWLFYLHGRFSPYASTRGLFAILFIAMLVFILYSLITRVQRLLKVRANARRNDTTLLCAEIGVLIVFIIVLLTPIRLGSWPSTIDAFLCGFRDRARQRADFAAIRNWLETLEKEYLARRSSFVLRSGSARSKMQWPDSIDWCDSVKVFRPYFIQFPVDDEGNLKIKLCWGTGMTRSWGVEIGPEDMEIPPSDLRRYGEYRLDLEPGSYVWHEIR